MYAQFYGGFIIETGFLPYHDALRPFSNKLAPGSNGIGLKSKFL